MKMKPGDWIDVEEIPDINVLRAIRRVAVMRGWNVSSGLGRWGTHAHRGAAALLLNASGNLTWVASLNECEGRQVHVRDLLAGEGRGHSAAAILREIAEVAEWHPEPWREFEGRWNGDWGHKFGCLDDLLSYTAAHPNHVRRKPRTKRIGNYDVPLPEREAPEVGTGFWLADPGNERYFCGPYIWTVRDGSALMWLRRDLIHLDPKSAETHGRALASLMQEDEE